MPFHRLYFGALLLTVLLGGCSQSVEPTAPPRPLVASVSITPTSATLAVAQTQQLVAVVRAANGSVLTDRTINWTSADVSIATVSASGLATALRPGRTTVTATSEGLSGVAEFTVLPPRPVVASVSLTPTAGTLAVAQTQQLVAVVRAADGTVLTDRAISWTSADVSIAAVSATGLATALRPGRTTVTATSEGQSGVAELIILPPPSVGLQIAGLPSYAVRGDTATLTWQAGDATTCEAAGRWSGTRAVAGSARVPLDTTGSISWGLRCTGIGGQVTQTVAVVSHLPVAATSYDNFKSAGVWPTVFPYGTAGQAFGDFLGTGALMLFSTQTMSSFARPITEARPGNADWWTLRGDSLSQPVASANRNWVRSTAFPVTVLASNCILARKLLVADINRDRRPDVVEMCSGYDATPFPGESNLILLSQPNGGYVQQSLGTPVLYSHGGALCDLDRNGGMKLLIADGQRLRAFDISVSGAATVDATHRLSQVTGSYYSVECLDVDGDGWLDVVAGGHEPGVNFGNAPTTVWFGSAARTFTPRVIPTVPGEGVVLDFTLTVSGSARTLWLMRTAGGGGDGTFYQGGTLQRVDVATFASSVVVQDRSLQGYSWMIPYVRNGIRTLGNSIAGSFWSYNY